MRRVGDTYCLEKLAAAVEAMLMARRVDHGLAKAFEAMMPLTKIHFPTEELGALFESIEQRRRGQVEAALRTDDLSPVADKPLHSIRLLYEPIGARTKHWFKKKIWELYRGCVIELTHR